MGALVPDVLLDAVLVAVLPDRAHEVPIRPELAAPQLLLHLRAGGEDLFGGDALDGLHDLLRAVGRD